MAKKRSKKIKPKTVKSQPQKVVYRSYFIYFLVVFSFLLYANTLGHQYAFDDSIVITENPYTQAGFKGIPKLLTSDFFEGIYGFQTELTGGRYRPLSLMTFAIEYQFFGENPFFGHLFNIVFYALTVLMIFLVLEQWFGKQSAIPYIASLLFLVLPVHTEVVANIKSRDELLCFLLLLGALYQFVKRYSRGGKNLNLVYSGIFYLLSLMAKETAITYLPVFPLIVYYFRETTIKESLIKTAPIFGVAIFYIVLRISMVGMIGGADSADIMENPFVNSGFAQKYSTIAVILLRYLALLFFPHPLTSDYSFNHIPFVTFSSPLALLGIAVYLFLGIYMLRKILRKDIPALAILLYLAPLSIVSNIVFNIGAPMGERFLFIPSLGFALAAAWFFDKWLLTSINSVQPVKAILNNKALPGILAVILVAFSIKTVIRNADWYDNNTLFAKDIITSANSAKMQYYYANTFVSRYMSDKSPENRPLLDTAEQHLTIGLEINPDFVFCLYNMGLVKSNKDEGEAARYYLDETLKRQPGHKKAFRQLGEVYGRLLNDYDKALYYLETARNTYGDNDKGLLQNLGNVYAMKGDHAKAIPVFEELIKGDPANAGYHINLGLTYQSMGDQANAERYFSKARELDPGLNR